MTQVRDQSSLENTLDNTIVDSSQAEPNIATIDGQGKQEKVQLDLEDATFLEEIEEEKENI